MTDTEKLADEIAITWHYSDVLEVRPDLTGDQARAVLKLVRRTHDANFGVNWDTLGACADSLFPKQG